MKLQHVIMLIVLVSIVVIALATFASMTAGLYAAAGAGIGYIIGVIKMKVDCWWAKKDE